MSTETRSGDEVLIASLTAGATLQEAATAAGVSAKTVSRRLREPEFAKALRDARRMVIAVAVNRLASSASEAVDELRSLLSSSSDSIRLRAAVAILDSSHRMLDAQELVERLAAVETQLAGVST